MNCLKMTEAIEMSFGMQNWWDHESMWGLDAQRERDIVRASAGQLCSIDNNLV